MNGIALVETTCHSSTKVLPEKSPVVEGEQARLHQLIDDHYLFVWRALRRLGVIPPDLEDSVQEVFVVCSQKLSRIADQSEKAFLFQTAVRVASHTRRSRFRRRREVGDENMDAYRDPRGNPEDVAQAHQRLRLLDTILDAMPDDLRPIFVLSELEQMTMAEIAKLMDTPAGTVASRLRRARHLFVALITDLRVNGSILQGGSHE